MTYKNTNDGFLIKKKEKKNTIDIRLKNYHNFVIDSCDVIQINH